MLCHEGINGPTGEMPNLSSSTVTNEPLKLAARVQALMQQLPVTAAPFTDRYFQNTAEILKAEGMNPWVRAQVMIRKGPGQVGGIEEALAILSKYSKLAEHGGKIKYLPEGSNYASSETILTIEGPIQDFVELETIYLGVISAGTTRLTEGVEKIDVEEVEARMKAVVRAANGRPIIYMGARHWHYAEDAAISRATFDGGATNCSTAIGASTAGKQPSGTIPHVLENIMAYYHGKENAVREATKAFDRSINPAAPRIALIDYNNHEIDDAIDTVRALNGRLAMVRVDTCGENVAQGAFQSPDEESARALIASGVNLVPKSDPDAKYWYGRGVTVTGVYALRKALDQAGYSDVKLVLSSGFGNPAKIAAFMRAEEILGVRLADVFAVGGVFDSRAAKTDIVAVGEGPDDMKLISKAGRSERPNSRLVEFVL